MTVSATLDQANRLIVTFGETTLHGEPGWGTWLLYGYLLGGLLLAAGVWLGVLRWTAFRRSIPSHGSL